MRLEEKEFEVTQEDIDKGRRKKAQRCPIYRAIRRQLRDINLDRKIEVSVGASYVSYYPPGFTGAEMVKIPDNLLEFRKTFDRQGKRGVKPTKAKIKIPVEL